MSGDLDKRQSCAMMRRSTSSTKRAPTGAMPAYKSASIVRDGVRHNASWHIKGSTVHVSSAYGSKCGASTPDTAQETAERLLAEIIEARI